MPLTGGSPTGGLIRPGDYSALTRWARLNAWIDELRSQDWDVGGTGTILSTTSAPPEDDRKIEQDAVTESG